MAVFTNIDIKKRRELLKMTAATLAEQIGRDPTTIYNWESGKSDPDPDSMYQIAEAFGDLNIWYDWMRTKFSSYARLHPDTKQHELPGGFCKISCAALITLVCILACRMLGTPASHSIIGSLMILTPGIAFTMGIRDFVQGDYLSGTIRMIDALLIAASIAIGTGLVLSLYTFFTGVVVA